MLVFPTPGNPPSTISMHGESRRTGMNRRKVAKRVRTHWPPLGFRRESVGVRTILEGIEFAV